MQKVIKKQRLKILNETVEYYQHNQRCIKYTGYEDDQDRKWTEGMCVYSGRTIDVKTDGDAIGRLLTDVQRTDLDNKYGEAGVHIVWEDLPEDIKVLGQKFLIQLSLLHDDSRYWNGNVLSELGEDFYHEIKENFC